METAHAGPEKKSFFRAVSDFFHHDLVSYSVKRILLFIPTLLLISIIIFFVIQLPPGDYVTAQITAIKQSGVEVNPQYIEELRSMYGLDKPFLEQYLDWISGIIWTNSDSMYYRLYGSHHNWRYSFSYGQNVWSVIAQYLPLTMTITFITMILNYLITIPLGVYNATHQYSVGDYTASILTYTGSAIPGFVLALLCMYLAYRWTGNASVGIYSTDMVLNGVNWNNFGEFLGRMIIPFFVLGFGSTCGGIRSMRAYMLDETARQYTLTARAKGVSEKRIIWKYCFRAAINPTVTGLGGVLSELFSGSTITAMVLNLAVLGPVSYKAVQSQDMYLAGAIVMIQAFLVEVGVLLADIGLAALDPRIRFSGGSR